MKITVLGAGGGEVTGSSYLMQTSRARVLVDCGLFQGSNQVERLNRPSKKSLPNPLHGVVVTHAHLDHVGRLPLLVKAGFVGPIHATKATIEMASLILRDAASLQEADAERTNRRRQRQGQDPIEPLYNSRDVERVIPLFKPLPYEKQTDVAPGVTVRAVEAGHMLGSASLQFTLRDGERQKIVVFSGDIGPRGAPLHRDPVPFKEADVVFLESTYGDRDHRPLSETIVEAKDAIREAIAARGKILVPVFAVGRTQILLYLLAAAFKQKQLPKIPVYVDSPMAIQASKVYAKNMDLFDEEAIGLAKSGELARNLSSVRFCATSEESRALNEVPGPCLIMAGAGMCTGGRILHHLRHNLHATQTHVLIVGYQSQGSLGRQLVDRRPWVTIFGERIPVRAQVHTIGGLSGHAGQTDLLKWFGAVAPARPRVVLTHGESQAREALAKLILKRHKIQAELPDLESEIEL